MSFDVEKWLNIDNDKQPKKDYSYNRDETPNDFYATLRVVEERSIDIAPSYEEWLSLGFAIADAFGEFGRDYYHRLSRFHSDYNAKDTDKQFTACLRNNKGSVKLSTFYHLAQAKGVDLREIAYERIANENKTLIVEAHDFTEKVKKSKKIKADRNEKIKQEKLSQLADRYYRQLANMYSPHELMEVIGREYMVNWEKRTKIENSKGDEVYINNILNVKDLERECCLKHICMLTDVLEDKFSFNFTPEELEAWINNMPISIFRGFYYDKTEHRFVSEYGNEFYCIENEIILRIKNLYDSNLNIQGRKFKDISVVLNEIAQRFIQRMYLTKDVDYPDTRLGFYESILGERTSDDFTACDIYSFFTDYFDCTDEDVDSLIIFIASTQRVHFFGDVLGYCCLVLTGDSGIGKDSLFPSICSGFNFLSNEQKSVIYKGSLYGATKFSTIDEKFANKLMYNWVSDDIESANVINKLDIINNPHFSIERKGKNNSVVVKRFNTCITANFKEVIFGKNYDPNAIVGRFLFANFKYKKGWNRSTYLEFYLSNQSALEDFYRNCFNWIWYNIATVPETLTKIRRIKMELQKDNIATALYKNEEDYQIFEIWLSYYNKHQEGYSSNLIDYNGDRWVYIDTIENLHSIFFNMRHTPSAKKIANTLMSFYGKDNVKYQTLIRQFGEYRRFAILVKKGLTYELN